MFAGKTVAVLAALATLILADMPARAATSSLDWLDYGTAYVEAPPFYVGITLDDLDGPAGISTGQTITAQVSAALGDDTGEEICGAFTEMTVTALRGVTAISPQLPLVVETFEPTELTIPVEVSGSYFIRIQGTYTLKGGDGGTSCSAPLNYRKTIPIFAVGVSTQERGAPPVRPAGVTAAASGSLVKVSWTLSPAPVGVPIMKYVVQSTPGSAECSTIKSTSCTVSGLKAAGRYSFTVTAFNKNGKTTSKRSNTVIVKGSPRPQVQPVKPDASLS